MAESMWKSPCKQQEWLGPNSDFYKQPSGDSSRRGPTAEVTPSVTHTGSPSYRFQACGDIHTGFSGRARERGFTSR